MSSSSRAFIYRFLGFLTWCFAESFRLSISDIKWKVIVKHWMSFVSIRIAVIQYTTTHTLSHYCRFQGSGMFKVTDISWWRKNQYCLIRNTNRTLRKVTISIFKSLTLWMNSVGWFIITFGCSSFAVVVKIYLFINYAKSIKMFHYNIVAWMCTYSAQTEPIASRI